MEAGNFPCSVDTRNKVVAVAQGIAINKELFRHLAKLPQFT